MIRFPGQRHFSQHRQYRPLSVAHSALPLSRQDHDPHAALLLLLLLLLKEVQQPVLLCWVLAGSTSSEVDREGEVRAEEGDDGEVEDREEEQQEDTVLHHRQHLYSLTWSPGLGWTLTLRIMLTADMRNTDKRIVV